MVRRIINAAEQNASQRKEETLQQRKMCTLGWKTTSAHVDLCTQGGQWLFCGVRLGEEMEN